MHALTYEAVIVGAGPAGSTAAFLLSRAGVKVLVLDRRAFPRPKLCAGLLTWKTTRLVEEIFSSGVSPLAAPGVVRDRHSEYLIAFRDRGLVQARMHTPFLFVDRAAYDSSILSLALGQGAVFLQEEVRSLDPSTMTLTTRNGMTFHAGVVIGADGAASRVKAALLDRRPLADAPDMATAIEITTPLQERDRPPEGPSIHFGYIPWGYAWSFPSGKTRVLGICGLNRRAPGQRVSAAFDEFLADRKAPPTKRRGHPLPYGNFLSVPGKGRVLLTGDACGLADPLLGEGIYYAHASAALASRAVLLDREAALHRYTMEYRRTILPELRYAALWRSLTFGLLKSPGYLPLKLLVSLFRVPLEETIHGYRSFKWLRRSRTPASSFLAPPPEQVFDQKRHG
jgi:menaquinone-9 beta-reductase